MNWGQRFDAEKEETALVIEAFVREVIASRVRCGSVGNWTEQSVKLIVETLIESVEEGISSGIDPLDPEDLYERFIAAATAAVDSEPRTIQ